MALITAAAKDLLPYRARVVLGHLSRRIRYAGMGLRGKTANQECSVCGRSLIGFVHGGKLCPFCTSFPRHRMFWPLLRGWLDAATGPVTLLLVAPDMSLRGRLVEHPKARYHGVDMFTPGHYYPPDTQNGDITDMASTAGGTYDLVICSHVLEHVPRDDLALAEIFRVLKPGGLALLCFPFRPGARTHEDPTITSPEARAREFGQWDHVRFYGEDAADRMRTAGFTVERLCGSDVFSPLEIKRYGLNPDEVFFVCRRPGRESNLSEVHASSTQSVVAAS